MPNPETVQVEKLDIRVCPVSRDIFRAGVCARIFAGASLGVNILSFCLSNSFFTGIFCEEASSADFFCAFYSANGVSTLFDALIFFPLILGFNAWGFLRFKAFASAGAFLYVSYSLGEADWIQFAAWIALGLLSVRLPFRAVLILGIISLALAILWNLGY